MPGKKMSGPDHDKGWLFCECIGHGVSPEEENEIFHQLSEMRTSFASPKEFVANVLERANLTPDVEKKLLLVATAGKMCGFFSG